MITAPGRPAQAAAAVGEREREDSQARVPGGHQHVLPGPGPSPVMLAGMSSPAMTLIALLFSAVLSTAAPRPRIAR